MEFDDIAGVVDYLETLEDINIAANSIGSFEPNPSLKNFNNGWFKSWSEKDSGQCGISGVYLEDELIFYFKREENYIVINKIKGTYRGREIGCVPDKYLPIKVKRFKEV